MISSASFVSAPLLVRGSTACHSTSVCIKSRSKPLSRVPPKLCLDSSQTKSPVAPETTETIIRDVWNKCEDANFSLWLPYFDEAATYHDTLYPTPFVGKAEIEKHLKNMEAAIPKGIVFILDDIAAGSDRVGARWHAETRDGAQIPFTRGASMYSFVRKEGKLLISEAWDFPETPLKLAGVVLPVLRGASALLSFAERLRL